MCNTAGLYTLWSAIFQPNCFRAIAKAVNFSRSQIGKFAVHRRQETSISQRLCRRNYRLDGCIVWNEHSIVFSSMAVCAQAVYFRHSTMLSVTSLRLNDVSVICRVSYFQFSIQSPFLLCLSARQHSGVVVYPISDVAENLGPFRILSVQPRMNGF